MSGRKSLVVALVIGAGALSVGCGGGDSTTDAGASGASGASGVSGAPLSKDAFIQQADEICKIGDKAVDNGGADLGDSPTPGQLKQFVQNTLVPNLQGEFDAIGALSPPDGDEDAINSIVSSGESALDEIKSDPSTLLDSASPFEDVDQLAQAYGLKVCGAGN